MFGAVVISLTIAAVVVTMAFVFVSVLEGSPRPPNRQPNWSGYTPFLPERPPQPTTALGRAELQLRRYLEIGEIDDEEYHRLLNQLTGRYGKTDGQADGRSPDART